MVTVRLKPEPRFNVLLTEDRPHADVHWTRQLPRLLEPQGVVSYVAQTAREAIDMAERTEVHAAVIDLATPLGDAECVQSFPVPGMAGGLWLLELLRRLPNRPPVVIVRGPAFSPRHADRLLTDALRLGVFSVVDKPVELEQLLTVFRRLMDKRYRGTWPVG